MTSYDNVSTLPLPLLSELNRLPCERNVLMLLRTLYTSDLAWMYMLLKNDSILDICDMCQRLLEGVNEGLPEHGIKGVPLDMTPDEHAECLHYITEMRADVARMDALKK